MKKLALFGTVLALGAGILVATHKSHAADHLDAPAIKVVANAMADINDVYTWNTADGTAVNLAMTVSPGDDGTRHFGPSVQYVFHISSHPGADNAAAFNTAGHRIEGDLHVHQRHRRSVLGGARHVGQGLRQG